MAFCGKCGTQVADGAAFCGGCGNPVQATQAPQVQICSKCGAEIIADAAFCGNCGNALQRGQVPAAPVQSSPQKNWDSLGDGSNASDDVDEMLAQARKGCLTAILKPDVKKMGKGCLGNKGCLIVVGLIFISFIGMLIGERESAVQREKDRAQAVEQRKRDSALKEQEALRKYQETLNACINRGIKIPVVKMWDEYNANQIRFKTNYENTAFIVVGTISEVRSGYITDQYIVELSNPNDLWGITTTKVVYPANISETEQRHIASLQPGHIFEAFVSGRATPHYVDVIYYKQGGKSRTEIFPTRKSTLREDLNRGLSDFETELNQGLRELLEYLQ